MCYLTLFILSFEPFLYPETKYGSFLALQIYKISSTLPTFIEKKCYTKIFLLDRNYKTTFLTVLY